MNAEKKDFLQQITSPPALQAMEKLAPRLAEWGVKGKEFFEKESMLGWEAPDPEIFKDTFAENPSFLRGFSVAAGAVPSLALSLLIHAATGGSSLIPAITLSVVETQDIYYKSKEAGGSEAKALGLFATAATVVAGLEYLSLKIITGGAGKFVKTLPEKSALKKIVQSAGIRTRASIAKHVTKNMAKVPFLTRLSAITMGGIGEGSTEVGQQVWQNAVTKFGIDKTQSLWAGTLESFIGGLGGGMMMTAGYAVYENKKQGKILKQKVTDFQTLLKEAEDAGVDIDQFVLMAEKAFVSQADKIDTEINNEVNENLDFVNELKESVEEDAKKEVEEPTPAEVSPLATEAKKFDNVEEFVKSKVPKCKRLSRIKNKRRNPK